MKLYIDTRDRNTINISIIEKSNSIPLKVNLGNEIITPESALEIIYKGLKEKGLDLDKISEIEVEKGPGSYTGVRIGVALANALSFALGIHVNNIDLSEIEVPKY